jgi:hypothetical protein
MARATVQDIERLLLDAGASDEDATRIVSALQRAEVAPPRMRAWLASSDRAYPVSTGDVLDGVDFEKVPIHAIEDGRSDVVVQAAEAFAAASADERFISLTCLCGLDAVRRLTHDDPVRTTVVVRIAEILRSRLRKEVLVNETLQTTLSGDFEDTTRIVDWMLGERLPDVLRALETGELDPVELHARDCLYFVGW